MKVLGTSQIRAADQFTIENEPIKSIDLMERASMAFTRKFAEIFVEKTRVRIFCGTGNNGGDGLAIGRLLIEEGWNVHIYAIGNSGKTSIDFGINLNRTEHFTELKSEADFPQISADEIVIDALFGSGVTRPIEGLFADLINHLNDSSGTRVSVDIASGLFADESFTEGSVVFEPHHTISFQLPKLVFFLPETHPFVGEWHIVDIGLNSSFIEAEPTDHYYTEKVEVENLIPVKSKFSHKSEAGRLLLVAGSRGKMGAAALCATAALRSGVGLINVCVPKCGVDIIQVLVPEAMVIEDQDSSHISRIPEMDSTLGIGPGIGTEEKTSNALADFLNKSDHPLVLDADALNILSKNKKLIKQVPDESILTPHPGEFKRLVGSWKDDFEKLELLKSFSREHRLNVVLKGAFSAVCSSEGTVWFNSTGNPGMATAGSGDVLTGIISSFLAQGCYSFVALKLGVYIHGMAGDLAAAKVGQNSLIASDIIEHISNAIRKTSVSNFSSKS